MRCEGGAGSEQRGVESKKKETGPRLSLIRSWPFD